ncbi:hypothetical protein [Reyranella sp.]|jgi:hypothetical protein|uniref:hypothetical protein n=1 Tax=Reyranella sp. TaxID=1929291 RepID=UPI002616BC17|nr:hypothetical protein [Reyranella sp.]
MQFGFCVVFSVLAAFAATGTAAQTSDVGPKPPRPTVDSMIDDILKGRASPQKSPTPETSPHPAQQVTRPASAPPVLASPLTAREVADVQQKIRPCWNTQQGRITERMIIAVTVEMSQDGRPAKAALRDTGRYYSGDPVYCAAADAALNAINNPRCQPWPLPPEKYQSWKTMTFNFDPRDF